MLSPIRIQEYLRRMACEDIGDAGLPSLRLLQKSHLLHVPFENLDIHLGKRIIPDPALFYEKIVIRRRGGFCYELNGLFYELLTALHYDVHRVSAGVWSDDTRSFGPDYDHLALVVRIDGIDYLADVGFGEFAFHPLVIHDTREQQDERGRFRVEPADDNFYLVYRYRDTDWHPEYRFTTEAKSLEDFTGMLIHHQTSNESPFTKKIICSLPVPNGRITVSGDVYKETLRDQTDERSIGGKKELHDLLQSRFGIQVSL